MRVLIIDDTQCFDFEYERYLLSMTFQYDFATFNIADIYSGSTYQLYTGTRDEIVNIMTTIANTGADGSNTLLTVDIPRNKMYDDMGKVWLIHE
mgnify:CR=1 FL=1